MSEKELLAGVIGAAGGAAAGGIVGYLVGKQPLLIEPDVALIAKRLTAYEVIKGTRYDPVLFPLSTMWESYTRDDVKYDAVGANYGVGWPHVGLVEFLVQIMKIFFPIPEYGVEVGRLSWAEFHLAYDGAERVYFPAITALPQGQAGIGFAWFKPML